MILITGGLGYIGSHVNKSLSGKGHETVVVDNLVCGHREFAKWGKFELGDLSDTEGLREVFKKYPIEAVMHFAGYAYVGESVVSPDRYYRNNVVNTLNLLQVMMENEVSHFIFSSSCSIYGIPQETPIPEDHPRNPVSPYGRTKLIIEDVLKDYDSAYGMKHISLRYFNASGADLNYEIGEWHESETHLIPLALDVAMGKRDALEVFGTDYSTPDGTCIRDYVHVVDLADAHILALEYLIEEERSDVFNLGNGEGCSVKQIIEVAEKVTGRKIKSRDMPRRPGDPPILLANSDKARSVLGWRPENSSIDTILGTAWGWHKKLRILKETRRQNDIQNNRL